MRESLNNNPIAQMAVIGVLLVAAGFLFLSTTGGGEGEGEGAGGAGAASTSGGDEVEVSADTAPEASGGVAAVPELPPEAAAAAPPPPRAVLEAFRANRTVALLFVRNGGIDDRLVVNATRGLRSLPDVSLFVVPAGRIARYAAIAQGVAVDRVPALVVLRPRNLDRGIPVASVSYGFQSPESVVQAVIDAGYRGRTLDYHP